MREGQGQERDMQGVQREDARGKGGVDFLGNDASAGEFCLADDRPSAEHKQLQTLIPLVVNLRAMLQSGFKVCPEIGDRCYKNDNFTQDPSEIPDGLVTTLSVIRGVGKG